jgi:DNA-binding SARP family transcriptional activator/ABC-type glycerol-3-phosphate transport system substrate-binding protein
MRVRFQLLGTLQVTVQDGSSATLGGFRQRMVLAVLLLRVGEHVAADQLIDAVWGDEPPPTARKTLQVYVARLRHALDGEALTGVPGGYLLQVDPADVDAACFERAAAEGRRLLQHDPEKAAATLRAGLALWRGTPWGDLGDQAIFRADVERLRERKLQALEDRLTADLALGRARSVTAEVGSLVAEHPLRERLRGLLMTALYQDGRTADALTCFEEGRRLLIEELGAEPGPGLRELHRRILQQDPTLVGGPAPTADPPVQLHNPYKGLHPFGEHDAEEFFGRERLVAELLERIASSPVVVLVGPSGSGKSSAVLAGLLPALRNGAVEGSDTWPIAVFRPGADPLGELRRALAAVTAEGQPDPPPVRDDGLDLLRAAGRLVSDDTARLVLVIDQFEELFLQVRDDADRERFIRDLAEAVEDPNSRLTVVAMLRADVLERPMGHPRLGPLMADSFVHVLPLAPAELEAASVVPARQIGVRIEPELAAELVAEAAGRPGVLPLFQYTLTELFEHRTGATITVHDYRRLGGLSGVVARRAEGTYDSLDKDAREACRQVFLRLVRIGDDGEVGRRRVVRDDLAVPLADLVLERFGAARLLAFDLDRVGNEPSVEVAHEAVFDVWPRLRAWIEEGRDQLRVQRSVAAAMHEWEFSGRDDVDLLSGSRLDLASAWCRRPIVDPTPGEEAYVQASLVAREREREQEDLRRQRELTLERRASGRLRQLVAVLALATLVAGTLGGVAVSQRSQAEQQTAEARRATELVRARQLASEAIATRAVDPELSVLLALHATNLTAQADIEIPPDIVEALHWSLQSRRVPYPGGGEAVVVSGPQGPQGVFALPLEQLVALAREEVSRDMTAEECADHFDSGCPTLPEQLPALQAAAPRAAPVSVDQPLAGTRVTLVHDFGGLDEGLLSAIDAFGDRTGITIDSLSPGDELGFIHRGLEAQTPPDIALAPYPNVIAPLVEDGELIDISAYLDAAELRTTLSPHLVSLGTVADDGAWPADQGGVYGIPVKVVNKSTVWYSLPAFEQAGYELPTTYDELVALTDRIVADGGTPWCHGEWSNGHSGWPGTDLIENLLLHDSLEDYDAWLRHDLGFTSTPLGTAFQRMGRLLLRPGHVAGGHASAATMPFMSAPAPLFDDPPGCLLYPQGSFAPSWFPFGVVVGRDVDVFPFPPVNPDQEPVVLGAGDYAMTFTDRPEVREAMEFLITEEFGREWARDDPGFMSPRGDFPLEYYVTCPDDPDDPDEPDEPCEPDPVRASVAPPLRDALAADRFRFDGSDLLPHEVGLHPMWQAMVEFVGSGPDELDRILSELEDTWLERERAAAD